MKASIFAEQKVPTVLVALDQTEMDQEIIDYLIYLDKHINIDAVHFIHVTPTFDVFRAPYMEATGTLENAWQLNEAASAAFKEQVTEVFKKTSINSVHIEITSGNPLEVILEEAKTVNPNLIMIGDKDRSETRHILNKNLVRKADAPVLFVPNDAVKKVENILVPIDFSSHSGIALKEALSFQEALNEASNVNVVNIYEVPDVSPYFLSKPRSVFKQMLESNIQEAFETFKHNLEVQDKAMAFTLIEKERPGIAHYIADAGKSNDAGLIIVGAKGHSMIERLLIGSVTEHLLAIDSQIPVLVVKD